jgi:hypothetical protein
LQGCSGNRPPPGIPNRITASGLIFGPFGCFDRFERRSQPVGGRDLDQGERLRPLPAPALVDCSLHSLAPLADPLGGSAPVAARPLCSVEVHASRSETLLLRLGRGVHWRTDSKQEETIGGELSGASDLVRGYHGAVPPIFGGDGSDVGRLTTTCWAPTRASCCPCARPTRSRNRSACHPASSEPRS